MDQAIKEALRAILSNEIDILTGEFPPWVGGEIDRIIRDAVECANLIKPLREKAHDFIPKLWSKLNGVVVKFEADSDPDLLYRDFMRAMNGCIDGPIGPYPSKELSAEEIASDALKAEENREAAERAAEAWRREAEKERRELECLLSKCRPMEFSDEDAWQRTKEVNQDEPCGDYVLRYAENWARLMQQNIKDGSKLEDVAEESSHVADTEGLTGYQYGLAVSILAKCWKHGEELRRWHNKETQIGTEGDRANEEGGTLNPALLSFC